MQSKVTIPPHAMSSHSMGGAQATALDYAADSNGESPIPKVSWHRVMRSSPKKVWPDPMWEVTKWWEACVETPGWLLVAPLMNAGIPGTRELTKHFLAMWQWMVEVAATNFCLPTPSMLNIGQFLDEEGDHMPWLLAYTCALQHMGEVTEGRMWCPMGMRFTLQVSPLVDAFIKEIGAELTELGIASCWGQLAVEVPLQKQDGPFTDVIAYLDDLAWHVPTQKAWDELVFPAPLTEPGMPCKSNHFSYILGHMVDLGVALLPLRFHMTEPSGKFVGVAHGLLFEGNILIYDLASNGMEWVPVQGTVNDLSPVEDSSAQEFSNITLLDSPKDIPQMDQFGECCWEPTPMPPTAALCATAALHDEEEVINRSHWRGKGSAVSAQRGQTHQYPAHRTVLSVIGTPGRWTSKVWPMEQCQQ